MFSKFRSIMKICDFILYNRGDLVPFYMKSYLPVINPISELYM